MALTHLLGYPRIGERRELKFALESFWQGTGDAAALQHTGAQLRHAAWQRQRQAGLGMLSAGDFAFYDPMLDHALMFGAIPTRFAAERSDRPRG